ncbi:DNA-directed RNA polymerase III subunit rpc31 [Ceratobasidium theobromae]|uniref:DNA-directed RNA polymerase III subunit n=1 Tax=Ceratobasidium theobromae TaxID=1582974 RepID=A0A5N5QQF4_9AGAM|nr:DNA-directed RNA polymerase III subunit rpc31 [Ceratobasidium theobromae]
MSRGGRGGFGGGRGFGGASNMPPMGLSFADIQSLSREPTALYPPVDPLPLLSPIADAEKEIIALQEGVAARLRASPYYIVESHKKDDEPRYSDKFLKSTASVKLQAKDLNPTFFPPDLWDAYFNPKKRKAKAAKERARLNLDNLEVEEGKEEEGSEKASGAGSDEENQADYDDENEDENDYADNYFDNGEDDDYGEDGGDEGGGTYD